MNQGTTWSRHDNLKNNYCIYDVIWLLWDDYCTYCDGWPYLLISFPATLDHSRKNLSNRISRAIPLSIKSILLIFSTWPSNTLIAWKSSFPWERCSVKKDWIYCPDLRLIPCLWCSICLHVISRWNSLLSPWKHSGHWRTLPPSWEMESAVL